MRPILPALFLASLLAAGGGVLARGADSAAPIDDGQARGVWVRTDRWPDSRTLESFARDVLRLEDARTGEARAIAVWNWVRMLMRTGPALRVTYRWIEDRDRERSHTRRIRRAPEAYAIDVRGRTRDDIRMVSVEMALE